MITLKKAQYEKLIAPKGKSEQTLDTMRNKEIARLWQEQGEMLVRIKQMEEHLKAIDERIAKIGLTKA